MITKMRATFHIFVGAFFLLGSEAWSARVVNDIFNWRGGYQAVGGAHFWVTLQNLSEVETQVVDVAVFSQGADIRPFANPPSGSSNMSGLVTCGPNPTSTGSSCENTAAYRSFPPRSFKLYAFMLGPGSYSPAVCPTCTGIGIRIRVEGNKGAMLARAWFAPDYLTSSGLSDFMINSGKPF